MALASGIAACVVTDGRVTRDDDPDGVYPWWSFTKTALAAAALSLVRDGRLDLDGPLRGRDFSLAELLMHRAGLPDYGGMSSYHAEVASGAPPWTDEEFLARTGANVLHWPKRGDFAYSNIGFLLLRRLIEEFAAAPIGPALDRMALSPLGIEGAFVAREPAELQRSAIPPSSAYNPRWVAHGLLVGPPSAAALLLDRLVTSDFLPAELRSRMCAGSPVPGAPFPGRPWRKPAYGLGVMTDADGPFGRQIGHTGQGYSVAAVYRYIDISPPRTVACFRSGADMGAAEWAAISLASDGQIAQG